MVKRRTHRDRPVDLGKVEGVCAESRRGRGTEDATEPQLRVIGHIAHYNTPPTWGFIRDSEAVRSAFAVRVRCSKAQPLAFIRKAINVHAGHWFGLSGVPQRKN